MPDGCRERAAQESPWSNVWCRGGVPVPDSKGLWFPSGWRCRSVGDKCISHCYRRDAEMGWGCAGEGYNPLHSPLPKLNSPIGNFLAKRLIKRSSLRVFYQDRGSAWPGVSQAVPSVPAAPGAPAQAPWSRAQLGCGDCTDLLSILSSPFLLGSPKTESAGSSDSRASESLGFSECESRNFSAALGRLPSTQHVSPSSPHLALQVGQWQSW